MIRWNSTGMFISNPNGTWVEYEDYQALEAINQDLLAQIDILNQKLIQCGCDGFGYGEVYGGFYGD